MSTNMEYANVNVDAVKGKKSDWPKGGKYAESEPLYKWNVRVLQALDVGGGRGGKEGQAWHEKKLIHTEESLT